MRLLILLKWVKYFVPVWKHVFLHKSGRGRVLRYTTHTCLKVSRIVLVGGNQPLFSAHFWIFDNNCSKFHGEL